jgi:ABC-2 type transport system ATP-binding protein
VGVIDEGRLVAEGTRRELVAQVGGRDRVKVTVAVGAPALGEKLRGAAGVDQVEVVEGGLEVLAAEGRRVLRTVVEAADAVGVEVDGIELVQLDLEAVFLHLTGKALRD